MPDNKEIRNWFVRVYAEEDEATPIASWHIKDRTEHEAHREAESEIEQRYPGASDWTIMKED